MTKRDQIEDDLLRNAHERLSKWRDDTIMRCEAMDLPFGAQASIMLSALHIEAVAIALIVGLDKEIVKKLIDESYDVVSKKPFSLKNKF